MADKAPIFSHFTFLSFLLAALFCLSGNTVLRAQEADYRLEADGHFIQILKWKKQENVLYYELEIEKQAEKLWEGALTAKTEALSFEVSLTAGIYRYRIRAYDLLGRPGQAADWIQFEVFPAKQPELVQFSPAAFYLDEDLTWIIHLSGSSIAQGSEIFLQGAQGTRIRPGTIIVDQPEKEVRLVFSYEQLYPGDYAVHVINPGGLETELETFRITFFRKSLDINVSAGYKPLVSCYGQINKLFEKVFFPAGAYSRLSVVPIKQRWGYIGFELEPSWNYFTAARENFTVQAHLSGGMIYGVYQKRFSNRAVAFSFRIGGGIYSVLDYYFTFDRGKTDPMTILVPAAAGVSFKWFIRKPFFVEAGLDFTHFFTVDDPSPGYLRPFAGAGWQF
jgi:hypothetical protein